MAQNIEHDQSEAARLTVLEETAPEAGSKTGLDPTLRKRAIAIGLVAAGALGGYLLAQGGESDKSTQTTKKAERTLPVGYEKGEIGIDYPTNSSESLGVLGDVLPAPAYIISDNAHEFMVQTLASWENVVNSDDLPTANKHLEVLIGSTGGVLAEQFLHLQELNGEKVHTDYFYNKESLVTDFSNPFVRKVHVEIGRLENGQPPQNSRPFDSYLLTFAPHDVLNAETNELIAHWRLTNIEISPPVYP